MGEGQSKLGNTTEKRKLTENGEPEKKPATGSSSAIGNTGSVCKLARTTGTDPTGGEKYDEVDPPPAKIKKMKEEGGLTEDGAEGGTVGGQSGVDSQEKPMEFESTEPEELLQVPKISKKTGRALTKVFVYLQKKPQKTTFKHTINW